MRRSFPLVWKEFPLTVSAGVKAMSKPSAGTIPDEII
jgi:hypothetical protein